jgi:hypothetical protein
MALAAAATYPGPASSGADVKVPDAGEFVRAAVYDGLAADGVSPDLARELANNPDFIKGCKLCEVTHTAIAEYANLVKAPAAKPGRGLAEETVKKLRSEKAEVRLPALRDLIIRYMGFAYDRANLPAAQQALLQQGVKSLVLQLKDPDGPLPGNMPFCPSCDGACRKKPAVISE